MTKEKLMAGLVFLAFAMFASAVQAFITLDAIVPASPMPGEPVAMRVSAGICDSIIEADGFPQITQTENAIRILLATTFTEDIILCNSEPGTVEIPFGAFPSGNYTLQLDRQYIDFFGATIIENVGTATFVVRGTTGPVPLYAFDLGSLLVLVLGVFASARMVLASRRAVRTNES